MSKPRCAALLAVALLLIAVAPSASAQSAATTTESVWRVQEVMVPMRDGVHLQTVIIRRRDQTGPLPILLRRTPYGVPTQQQFDEAAAKKGADWTPDSRKELAADGYIFVIQNLRGRFKSEGDFKLTSRYDANDPKQTNETTDAYDTIDWLVKNVPNNNGKVGMYGVSYDGLTAGLTLLHPHPALKAMSEQASPVDQWMNDDITATARCARATRSSTRCWSRRTRTPTRISTSTPYDTYSGIWSWGRCRNVNAKYLHGSIPFWNDNDGAPRLRRVLEEGSVGQSAAQLDGPESECGWILGPGRSVGAVADLPSRGGARSGPYQLDGGGAVVSRRMADAGGRQHRADPVRRPRDSARVPQNIEAPFFRYYLHGEGAKPEWQATMFQTGSNTWQNVRGVAAAGMRSRRICICTRMERCRSSRKPRVAQGYREYVSDPANPVPYRTRPISPTYPQPEWRTWEVADQRFVEDRPDVLTYESAPLDHDVTITGPVSAKLFASTSGTDADFVVKLIDVYPEKAQKSGGCARQGPTPGKYADSLNGYELPIAMEVRRGRYLQSYEQPQALEANHPQTWDVPLRDHDHVFLKGHRIMVQVQSTWFPVIDRNPQKFVPSIYQATAADYVPATQRVYCYAADAFAHRAAGGDAVENLIVARKAQHLRRDLPDDAAAISSASRRRAVEIAVRPEGDVAERLSTIGHASEVM